jgi:hypothetical protein
VPKPDEASMVGGPTSVVVLTRLAKGLASFLGLASTSIRTIADQFHIGP